jgi:hypothetical protein
LLIGPEMRAAPGRGQLTKNQAGDKRRENAQGDHLDDLPRRYRDLEAEPVRDEGETGRSDHDRQEARGYEEAHGLRGLASRFHPLSR